jgi:hypothetical protein
MKRRHAALHGIDVKRARQSGVKLCDLYLAPTLTQAMVDYNSYDTTVSTMRELEPQFPLWPNGATTEYEFRPRWSTHMTIEQLSTVLGRLRGLATPSLSQRRNMVALQHTVRLKREQATIDIDSLLGSINL